MNPIENSISSIALPAEMLSTPKPIIDLVSLPRIITDAVAATEVRVVLEKKFRFVVNCGRLVALRLNVEVGQIRALRPVFRLVKCRTTSRECPLRANIPSSFEMDRIEQMKDRR